MLHELHVVEVDDTRVVLVHRVDLGHFVVGEAEVEVLMQNNGNSTKQLYEFGVSMNVTTLVTITYKITRACSRFFNAVIF